MSFFPELPSLDLMTDESITSGWAADHLQQGQHCRGGLYVTNQRVRR